VQGAGASLRFIIGRKPGLSEHRTPRLLAKVALLAATATIVSLPVPSVTSAAPATVTVAIQGVRKPHFVASSSAIVAGGAVTIDDHTSGLGAHTFSLVKKSAMPTTKAAQKSCSSKGHICRAIKKRWTNDDDTLSAAGAPGWDKLGDTKHEGDSHLFAGNQLTSVVSAQAGTTLHFMCALHPFMQGKLKVE
jgi:hypothetical protein